MSTKEENPFLLPRHGYISELANMCNCSRKTVTRALFHGQKGPKADKVRETFYQHFQNKS